MSEIPTLAEQEEQGLYEEELQKLVGGVEMDIINGRLQSQDEAREQLSAAALQSVYVRDETKREVVRKYSLHAAVMSENVLELSNSWVAVCVTLDAITKLAQSVHYVTLVWRT